MESSFVTLSSLDSIENSIVGRDLMSRGSIVSQLTWKREGLEGVVQEPTWEQLSGVGKLRA